MARANEQQKQKQQQKKQQKQQQQQQKQRKQKQDLKHPRKQQQRNGGGEMGALPVDSVKARIPAICTNSLLWYITVRWLSLLLTAGPLCVGRNVGRVGEGHGCCDCA